MKIIYLGPDFAIENIVSVLKKDFHLVHVTNYEMLKNEIKDCFGILDASMKFKLSKDILEQSAILKTISCATTGSDHIDSNYLKSKGITLHTLKEDPDVIYNLTPAAELSWALLMACARRLPGAISHVKNGYWNRESFPSICLKGKQLGLVGMGRIGSWMARYAHAFGMDVVTYDPYSRNIPETVRLVSLTELVETSDFISVHVPLNNETLDLLSEELIAKVKPGVIVINTSRGGIVNEKALLDGLLSGKISAAGLDVLQGEPNINNHPLVEYARRHDNLLITPHCGGFSPDAVKFVCEHAAKKINQYI